MTCACGCGHPIKPPLLKYASELCRQEYHVELRRQRTLHDWIFRNPIIDCIVCQRPFIQRKRTDLCCSPKCSHDYGDELKRQYWIWIGRFRRAA